jgi:hypothetical protein
VQRIIATVVALVASFIVVTIQEAGTFLLESTKHVAQVHGLFSPDMKAHFVQMGSLVCVCVVLGVLGRRIVLFVAKSLLYLVYHSVRVVLCIVWKTVRFWCWPVEAIGVMFCGYCRRLMRSLPRMNERSDRRERRERGAM